MPPRGPTRSATQAATSLGSIIRLCVAQPELRVPSWANLVSAPFAPGRSTKYDGYRRLLIFKAWCRRADGP